MYDLSGRLVWQSSQSQLTDYGNQTQIQWDLEGTTGVPVVSGVYLVKLEIKSGNDIKTRKTIKLMINRQ